jgi:hypothetical protein
MKIMLSVILLFIASAACADTIYFMLPPNTRLVTATPIVTSLTGEPTLWVTTRPLAYTETATEYVIQEYITQCVPGHQCQVIPTSRSFTILEEQFAPTH